MIISAINYIIKYTPDCSEWQSPANRKFHYLSYSLGGEYLHYIANKTLNHKKDHILILNKSDPYTVKEVSKGTSLNIAFSSESVLENQEIDCTDSPGIKDWFFKAFRLYGSSDEADFCSCMSYLYKILSFTSERNKMYFNSKTVSSLDEIKKHIDLNVTSRFSNAELAEIGQFSEHTLTKLFKEKYGITPNQYILQKRLALSKELLISESFSIAETAVISGFEDPCYFSRVFKQKVGLTPREYVSSAK